MSESWPELEHDPVVTRAEVMHVLNDPRSRGVFETPLSYETTSAGLSFLYDDCSQDLMEKVNDILIRFGVDTADWKRTIVPPADRDAAYEHRMKRLEQSADLTCGEFMHAATTEALSLSAREGDGNGEVVLTLGLTKDVQLELYGRGDVWGDATGYGWEMEFGAIFRKIQPIYTSPSR